MKFQLLENRYNACTFHLSCARAISLPISCASTQADGNRSKMTKRYSLIKNTERFSNPLCSPSKQAI